MPIALGYQADDLADSVTDPSLKEKPVDGAQLQNERAETQEGPTRCLDTPQVGSQTRSAITTDFGGWSKRPPP